MIFFRLNKESKYSSLLRPGHKKNKEPEMKDTVINYRTVDRLHDRVSDRFIDPRADPRVMEPPRLIDPRTDPRLMEVPRVMDPRMMVDPRLIDPRIRDNRVDARLMELNQQVETVMEHRPATRADPRNDPPRPETRADLHVRLREPSRDRNGDLKSRLDRMGGSDSEAKEKYVEKYLENLQRERSSNER